MKTVRKLTPTGLYDIDGVQTWLEQMSEQGLHLVHWGNLWCTFEKGAPKTVRYRLDPDNSDPKDTSVERPTREFKENYQAAGWRYLCSVYGRFHFFVSDDPKAPELYTDCDSFSYALKSLANWSMAGMVVLAALLIPVLWNVSQVAGELFTMRIQVLIDAWWTWVVLTLLLILAPVALLSNLYSLSLILRTRRALLNQKPLPKSNPRRRFFSLLSRLSSTLFLVLVVVEFGLFFNRFTSGVQYRELSAIPIPIPALAEVENHPGFELTHTQPVHDMGFHPGEATYASLSPSFLSPIHMGLYQTGEIAGLWWKDLAPDYQYNEHYAPYLGIELWQPRFGLSQPLFSELTKTPGGVENPPYGANSQSTELDWADQAALQQGDFFQIIVIRLGDRVAKVTYYGVRDLTGQFPAIREMLLADWSGIFAN